MVEFEKYDTITVIDFETASNAYYSACALGIVFIRDKAIVDKQYYLIQPPDNYFDKANIDIHGITPEQTAAADTFPAVWEKVKQYFCNTYVAAHNASFDMSVLKATLDYYGIEQPDFLYMCSIQISGLNIPTGEDVGRTLEARCGYFGVPLCEHHNALCDAEACTGLILYALEHTRYKTIGTFVKCCVNIKQYEDIKIKKSFGGVRFRKIDIKEIAATVAPAEATDADFKDKIFVFTGELRRLTREQAIARVIAGGGIVKNGVTKKVDVLVNADTAITNKVQAALDLQAAGHHIKIVNDDQFMAMLASSDAINID